MATEMWNLTPLDVPLVSGVASYGALGHVPPRLPTISFLVHFTLK